MTAPDNYEQLKLIYDPNAGFGRNYRADQIGERGDELFDAGEEPVSDEGVLMQSLCNHSNVFVPRIWSTTSRPSQAVDPTAHSSCPVPFSLLIAPDGD